MKASGAGSFGNQLNISLIFIAYSSQLGNAYLQGLKNGIRVRFNLFSLEGMNLNFS